MFENAREFFRSGTSLKVEKSGEFTPRDLQIATAVLLIDLACQDGRCSSIEAATIADTVKKQFGLTVQQADEMLELAVSAAERTDLLPEMLDLINQHFDESQRQLLLACVWKVALADGRAAKDEADFATNLRTKLNIGIERALLARKMAENGEV